MTDEQAILLRDLKTKTDRLKEQLTELRTSYKTLNEENITLRNDLSELQDSHEELNHDHEMLKISRAFSGSEEEKQDLKKKIGLMVRDIDKCIELLNE